MLWRLANSLKPNQPVNVDRILGASYNTRSVLEALLAHTPQFYYCYPGRIESINAKTNIKEGHKHLLWNPENPHELGVTVKAETDLVISEIPAMEAYYEALVLPVNVFRKRSRYRNSTTACPDSDRTVFYWKTIGL
jgi:type II restriction enzyme